jgi:excisionase family DNA binding protein
MTEDKSWLTLAEAAERLGTKVRTVRTLVRQGRLPILFLSRHAGYRIRAADLDTLGTRTTTPQPKDEANG